MKRRKIAKKLMIISVAIISSLGLVLTGCGDKDMNSNEKDNNITENNNNDNKEKDYKKIALDALNEKYGEEFEVIQEGGTFAALKDSHKLICAVKGKPEKYTFVQVASDLSKVEDDYINRIMEEKFNNYIAKDVKDIFGDNVKVKIQINGLYNDYTSLDMEARDFMEFNVGQLYVMDIFIKANGSIDKKAESEKIVKFLDGIINTGISNESAFEFWYLKEDEFNKIDEKYPELAIHYEVGEYYINSASKISKVLCEIKDGKVKYNAKEIEDRFID